MRDSKFAVVNELCHELIEKVSPNHDDLPNIQNIVDDSILSLERQINENLLLVDVEKCLKNRNLIWCHDEDNNFVTQERKQFANFDPKDVKELDLKVKLDFCRLIESFISDESSYGIVFVSLPDEYFDSSEDISGNTIVQKLNLALFCVIEALKRSTIVEAKDNWTLFTFDNVEFESSVFGHCYVDFTLKNVTILKQYKTFSLRITCVPQNESMFSLENLLTAENHQQKVSDLQTVIGCITRKNILENLEKNYQSFPSIYKRCIILLHHWVSERKNLRSILTSENLVNLLIIFIKAQQISKNGEQYCDAKVFEVFVEFFKLLGNLTTQNRDSKPGDLNNNASILIQSPFCHQFNIFNHLLNVDVEMLQRYLKSVLSIVRTSTEDISLFNEIFVKKCSLFSDYDLIFTFSLTQSFSRTLSVEDLKSTKCRIDNFVHEKVIPLYREALGTRAQLVEPLRLSKKDLCKGLDAVNEFIPKICIGVKLNCSQQRQIVIKGPLPDNKEGSERFVFLWDKWAELRRFKDGTICYSISFPHASVSRELQRSVTHEILTHITSIHLGGECVDNVAIVSNILESQLRSKQLSFGYFKGTGEEELLEIKNTLEKFESVLCSISKQLPLQITSAKCSNTELCRNTSVLPADTGISSKPCDYKAHNVAEIPKEVNELKLAQKSGHRSINVQIILQTHDKWPSKNVEAVRRLKAAFYSKLAELLKKECSVSFATLDGLYVLYEGAVFNLSIFHPQEVKMLMHETRTPNGAVHWVQSEESKRVQLEQVTTPRLHVLLEGFEQFFPQFGPICRLVKVWINSHLLMFEFGDILVELLVAASLENAFKTGNTPGCMQSGLIEFWSFISSFDFVSNYIRVSLEDPSSETPNSSLTDKAVAVDAKFDLHRDQFPPLTIFTPVNEETSDFTSEVTSALLGRLIKLCSNAHSLTDSAFSCALVGRIQSAKIEQLFTASCQGFDAVIKLHTGKDTDEVKELMKGKKLKELILNVRQELKSDLIKLEAKNQRKTLKPAEHRKLRNAERELKVRARLKIKSIYKEAKKNEKQINSLYRKRNDSNDQYAPFKKARYAFPVFNARMADLVAKRVKSRFGHILYVFSDVYATDATGVWLKFKKNPVAEINEWIEDNRDNIFEEIEMAAGFEVIRNCEK